MYGVINKAAIEIVKMLERAGYEAYLVGGSIRDLLLNRKIRDYDIATNATPHEVKEIFHHVIPVGLEHGTVLVRKNGLSVEVTTFRKKASDDSFTFAEKIEDDLAFRDFTINALAMDSEGNIIDVYNGQADLNSKTIRAVIDPYQRLKEDPLRMLRAIRFSSQLGFTIEANTLQAICELKERIEQVAIERIKDEMTQLLQGDYFNRAKKYLVQSHLIEYLPVFSGHRSYIDILMKEEKPFISFSHAIALLHHFDETISINRWIKAWNGSNKEKKEAKNLLYALQEFENNGLTNWLIYLLDQSLHKPFIRLLDTIYNESITENDLVEMRKRLPIQARNELALSGHLVMQWIPDKKPGPWIQKLIEQTEYKVVMNQIENNEQKIKEWILCHPLATS